MDEIMKGITCCADCAYYNAKKHKCTRATDEGKPTDHFYADCPLPTVTEAQGWISVKDRLPAETHSIFWPWYGRKEWNNAMWREQSDKVLLTVTFEDGTCLVTTGETHDGEWHTSISKTLNPIVTHWMPLPEPPKEEENAD